MVEYRDPGPVEFDAVIVRNTDVANSTAWVEFPFAVAEHYGVKGRVPVLAEIDGHPYRGSLMRMGGGAHLLALLKEVREAIGKQPGDTVHVRVVLDTTPRTVELGEDARTALVTAGRAGQFDDLSYSRQREYQQWIDAAKRPETRTARIATMLDLLATGQRLK